MQIKWTKNRPPHSLPTDSICRAFHFFRDLPGSLRYNPAMAGIGILKTLHKPIRIGPEDDGRRMSLDQFDRAIGREGYIYELNKGVVEVTNVPEPKHAKQVQALRNQLVIYQEANPGVIDLLAGSNDAK